MRQQIILKLSNLSNYLPTHTFGVPEVSQTVFAGSVVQSASVWHSSTGGAKMQIGKNYRVWIRWDNK